MGSSSGVSARQIQPTADGPRRAGQSAGSQLPGCRQPGGQLSAAEERDGRLFEGPAGDGAGVVPAGKQQLFGHGTGRGGQFRKLGHRRCAFIVFACLLYTSRCV
ncbi:hypothetical protein [Arthrobacter sp. KBS0703]|uniref:hypothetical protein n=1 Tax=Arthrobacter sp. KBS0703 TaxID=1955698 RepID=UPI0037BEBDA3